jgi:hypothetical protein
MITAERAAEIGSAESAKHRRVLSLAGLVSGFLVLLASVAPYAAAQGCAMCYQDAASSGAQGRAALRHGILILLAPALSLFCSILVLIYRRRNVPR